MTQRIFDIENEKDMQDLWNILPDEVCKIEASCGDVVLVYDNAFRFSIDDIFSINFHDKTEITRPAQEATFNDIGKLCRFWNGEEKNNFGILEEITSLNNELRFWKNNTSYKHCHRLTKQEIEELC